MNDNTERQPTQAKVTSGRREMRPSFQLFPADFASSPKFRRMTLEERGAYLTLLLDAWMDRGIEADLQSIADRLDVDLEDAQRLMRGTLGRCFEERDGRLVNPRMERERERLEERSQRLAEAGARGGKGKAQPRQGKANTKPGEARLKPGLASAKPSEPEQSLSRAEPELEPELEPEPDPTAKAPRRAKRATCTLDEQLEEFEFQTLRSDIVKAAQAWSAYRRERRPALSPWGPAQWRPALRDAIQDPAAFNAAVEFSIRQKYQGLFPAAGAAARPPRNGAQQSIEDLAAVAARLDARLAAEGRL